MENQTDNVDQDIDKLDKAPSKSCVKYCEICLGNNIRMHPIKSSEVQGVYELITNRVVDSASPLVCYMCYRQLQNCRRLVVKAHTAHKLLREILESGTQLNHKSISEIDRRIHGLLNPMTVSDVERVNIQEQNGLVVSETVIKKEVTVKEEPEEVGSGENKENEDSDKTADLPIDNASAEELFTDGLYCDKYTIKEESLLERPLSNRFIDILNHSQFSHTSDSTDSIDIDNKFIKPEYSVENVKINKDTKYVDNVGESETDTSNDSCTIIRQGRKSTDHVRGKDLCFYCKNLVSNFARHIYRQHMNESEVQRILSKPKKSLARHRLITGLRKKGNFIQNSHDVIKPMRRQNCVDYLPCTNCLGFYSKKLLYVHIKKCRGFKKCHNVQSASQNLLVKHLKIDENLKQVVFSRMRADKISLVAKSDQLICAFGSQCLKNLRGKNVHSISRKLRELAKLLMEMKNINTSITDLFSALKPINYMTIVKATRVVGKCDPEKDSFEKPNFAAIISTTLKQCCNIAIKLALKKQPYSDTNTAEIEEIRQLINIMGANWKYDISSQAANDLNKKKLNEINVAPLASDLETLKDYLNKKSEEAASKIKEGSYSMATYLQLLELVYCKVLLLNGRGPRVLQSIKLQEYMEGNVSEDCDQFNPALTASELTLVKRFKRVAIRGKRGCRVIVLFSPDVQNHIEVLLSIRKRFLLTSNDYLFGNPGYENTINGYAVFDKHTRHAGAKNPKSFSYARLKQHLPTVSKIFMSENNEHFARAMSSGQQRDGDKIATFIGQNNKESIRLPIPIEDGKADALIGKPLDDIDLDLNDLDHLGEPITPSNINQETVGESNLPQAEPLLNNCTLYSNQMISVMLSKSNTGKQKNRKRRILVPWTLEQKNTVTKFFKTQIENRQPPKKHECEKLKERYPELLKNKDWHKIKVFVQNIYSKKYNV